MRPTLGSPGQYRDFAAQCRDWAARVRDEKHHEMMLQLANHWMRMAQDLERAGTDAGVPSGVRPAAPLPQGDVRQGETGGAPATLKAHFSSDEWTLLLESAAMAGIVVAAADPGRLWHMIKENCAGSDALAQASMNPASNPLVRAVAADFGTPHGRSIGCDGLRERLAGVEPRELRARCIETLARAAAMVDAKAPADAAAFKCWLLHISERVVETVGKGAPPTGAETATFAEISRALQLKLVA